MISFRYHLVSLMAIFLAIAFGIVIGTAVVDQATVALLEQNLDRVERRADATDRRNLDLEAGLERWSSFADQAGDRLVEARLAGTPVVVVAVRGTSPELVGALRATFEAAGAQTLGTLWLTARLELASPEDVAALAAGLGVASSSPETVRRLFVARLATTLAGGAEPLALAPLREAGFLEVEPSAVDPTVDPLAPPPPGTRIVVAAGPAARVRNDVLAVPLVTELADDAARRVLAVEPTVDEAIDASRRLVAPLRADESVVSLVSSVDAIEDWRSRVAAVLALVEQGTGRTGHYGQGAGATSLLPPQPAGG